MKILLINPDSPQGEGRDLYTGDILTAVVTFKPWDRLYSGFPLALPTLAAVTPSKYSVKIIDEAVDTVDFNEECDVVGLTAMTFKARRAYEIAAEFRKRGKTVILGGIHATMCPDEAAGHVDCVVKGEAENIWPLVLDDIEHGRLKKFYQDTGFPDITRLPTPNYRLVNLDKYYFVYFQTSRGCPYDCEFCTVTKMNGRQMRFKSPGQVIAEIDEVIRILPYPPIEVIDRNDGKSKSFHTVFFFSDDNFAINREHAMSVCREIIQYQKRTNKVFAWFTQTNITAGLDDELLDLMKESHCDGLFMGFESLSTEALKAMNKKMNSPELYSRVIANVRRHSIECVFSTIVGSDYDTVQSGDMLVDFIEQNKVFYVLPNILTPYPGTRLRETMERQGRIIDRDTNHYNIRNVVFTPQNMTPIELQASYVKICERLFNFNDMRSRAKGMLDSCHIRYWAVLPWKIRIVSYILFIYSAFILCLRKKISWRLMPAIIYSMARDHIIHGTLIDFGYLAWVLDYDAFAKSERRRLEKIIRNREMAG